jgi:hypothetical protein
VVFSSFVDFLYKPMRYFSEMEKYFEERNPGRLLRFSTALQEGSADDHPGPAYEYLSQRGVGGNMATIHFGHAIDFVQNGRFSLS